MAGIWISCAERKFPGAHAWCTRARQSVFGVTVVCGMWSGDWCRMGIPWYRIYSLTKLYTAVAILQLLEAGKLHMEDPVAEYLPEYRSLQVNEVAANGWNEVREAKSRFRWAIS